MTAAKKCGGCHETLPLSLFNKNASKPDGMQHRCKPCAAAYYEANKAEILRKAKARVSSREGVRTRFEAHIRKVFGLTVHEYAAMWDRQAGACAICLRPFLESRVRCAQVDHCHRTGKVRGLLCHGCNTALGGFGESPLRLARAAVYIGSAS